MTGLFAALLFFGPSQIQPLPSGVFEVAEPIRLALTPRIDGENLPGEWDLLSTSGGATSYLQWEPGWLYAAAQVPTGQDLVISLDLNGDGWLVGRDNLEIRVAMKDGAPAVALKRLDATDRNGPMWSEPNLIPEIFKVAAKANDDGWFFELKMLDADVPAIKDGRKLGIRMDAEVPSDVSATAFLPRATALCNLQMERGAGMPEGFKWNADYGARSVVPGESINIRIGMTTPVPNPFKRVSMRTDGDRQNATATQESPFPRVDPKGRASVEYKTEVAGDAEFGYRILRATLTGDGVETVLRSSYLISDLVRFEVTLPEKLVSTPGNQVIKGSVRLRSQTARRLDGVFSIVAPEGWTVIRGANQKFGIYHARNASRMGVELVSPPGAHGLIPLILKAKIGDRVIEETYLLPIR